VNEAWRRHSNDVVEMKKKLHALYPEDHTVMTVEPEPPKEGTFVHVYDKFGKRIDARWVRINDGS
jgi:hypothetical protein